MGKLYFYLTQYMTSLAQCPTHNHPNKDLRKKRYFYGCLLVVQSEDSTNGVC